MFPSTITARVGALCYSVWGLFHVNVAHDIYELGSTHTGMAQGRLYHLAAYMMCIAVFAIVTGAVRNWRNGVLGCWLNLVGQWRLGSSTSSGCRAIRRRMNECKCFDNSSVTTR
jgi:hypothetical protein